MLKVTTVVAVTTQQWRGLQEFTTEIPFMLVTTTRYITFHKWYSWTRRVHFAVLSQLILEHWSHQTAVACVASVFAQVHRKSWNKSKKFQCLAVFAQIESWVSGWGRLQSCTEFFSCNHRIKAVFFWSGAVFIREPHLLVILLSSAALCLFLYVAVNFYFSIIFWYGFVCWWILNKGKTSINCNMYFFVSYFRHHSLFVWIMIKKQLWWPSEERCPFR